MAKATTSFRLSDQTKGYLNDLSTLLKESQTEILERAVKLLYDNREAVARADMDLRLSAAKAGNPS